MGSYPYRFLFLPYVVLHLGEHLDPGHEVLEVGWRVERQILLESLPKSQSELVTHHCQLLGALFNLVVDLLILLAVILD